MGEQFEGLKVEGSAIAAMPKELRYAIIIGVPNYQQVPDLNDKTKMIKKLIIPVELSNKSKAEYYPNKTSANYIAGRLGTDLDKWVEHKISWDVLNQLVQGQKKDVLYVIKVD
jgi:hypothetical protein